MRPEQDAAVWMRDRLREGLAQAFRNRQHDTVAALRSAIAAIDNAEAPVIDPGTASERGSAHIAGAWQGLGSTEVERRQLTRAEVRALLAEQLAECQQGVATYVRAGRPAEADRLRRQAAAVAPYVALLD